MTRGEIRVRVAGRSNTGQVRTENQDAMLVVDLARGSATAPDTPAERATSADFELTPEGAILLVADGVGGHQNGAEASRIAVDRVRSHMLSAEPSPSGPESRKAQQFVRDLARSLEVANAAVHAEARKEGGPRGMATTATLVGLSERRAYAAQIGDSRAYLVRDGSIIRLTRDQTLVQDLIESGILSEDDSHGISDNTILQALGPSPKVTVAVTYHDIRRGDLLLLCSDGLSGVVTDAEIGAEVTRHPQPAALCDALVGLANERGGPDNITVVAARIEGSGVDGPDDTPLVARQPFEPPGD